MTSNLEALAPLAGVRLAKKTPYDVPDKGDKRAFVVLTGEDAIRYARENYLFLRLEAVGGVLHYTPDQAEEALKVTDGEARAMLVKYFYCHQIEEYRDLFIRMDVEFPGAWSDEATDAMPVVPLARFGMTPGMAHAAIDAYYSGIARGDALGRGMVRREMLAALGLPATLIQS